VSTGRLNFGFARFSGLYIWLLFIIVFGLATPGLFLSIETVHSIASAQSIVAMLAIAFTVTLAAGSFDLSIGAVANFSTVTAVCLQTIYGWSMWPAVLATMVLAVLVGVINGIVVVRLKVPSLVATLGMGSMLLAAQTIIAQSTQPFAPATEAWSNLAGRSVFGFQIVVAYLVVLTLLAWWLMGHTPLGRYLYAIGGNVDASRLSGVNVNRWTFLSLVLGSTIAGFAGIAYASLNGPSLTYGNALLLPALAAVFLGSTQIRPGHINVLGTVLAIFVLGTGVTGLQLLTPVTWLDQWFSGAALIIAVAFAGWQQRRTGRGKRRTQSEAPATTTTRNDESVAAKP